MGLQDTVGHTVLATADSDVFASLRKRPTSRAERYAMGRALRRSVPAEVSGAVVAVARIGPTRCS